MGMLATLMQLAGVGVGAGVAVGVAVGEGLAVGVGATDGLAVEEGAAVVVGVALTVGAGVDKTGVAVADPSALGVGDNRVAVAESMRPPPT